MVGRIIEVTFTLVMAYLVFSNPQGFSQAASAVSDLYTNSVKTLQARS